MVKNLSSYVDPAYGAGNPYDPDTEPVLWQDWNNKHPSEYTTNTSGTKTPWWQIAATLGAGVGPFVAAGLASGAGAYDYSTVPYGEGYGVAPVADTVAGAPLSGAAATPNIVPAGAFTGPAAASTGLASDSLVPATAFGSSAAPVSTGAVFTGSTTAPAAAAAPAAMSGATYDTGFVGPMASTAKTVGTGAAAGSGIWSQFFKDHGADLASAGLGYLLNRSANKDAIAAQQQAAAQAIQTQQRIAANQYANLARVGQQQRGLYNQSQQTLAPYTSLGGGAAGALGAALGIPVSMPQPVAIPTDLNQAPNLNVGTQGQMNPRATPGPNPFPGSQPFNPNFNPSSTGGTVSFGQPSGGMPSQTVKMRAPTGEVEDVDLKDVPHFKAQGAVVVS